MLSWIDVLEMPHCSHVNCDVKPKNFFVVVSTLQGLAHAQNLKIVKGLDLGIFSVNIERFPNRQDRMLISMLLTESEV